MKRVCFDDKKKGGVGSRTPASQSTIRDEMVNHLMTQSGTPLADLGAAAGFAVFAAAAGDFAGTAGDRARGDAAIEAV